MSILYVLHLSTRFLYVSNLHGYFSYVQHISTRFLCVSNLHVYFCMSYMYMCLFCVYLFCMSYMYLREFYMCLNMSIVYFIYHTCIYVFVYFACVYFICPTCIYKNFECGRKEVKLHGHGHAKSWMSRKKSQHGCGRWAPQPHLTPPCSDFAYGGL